MTDLASRISGAAMLALAALPIGALATAAHAQTDTSKTEFVQTLDTAVAAQSAPAARTFAAR